MKFTQSLCITLIILSLFAFIPDPIESSYLESPSMILPQAMDPPTTQELLIEETPTKRVFDLGNNQYKAEIRSGKSQSMILSEDPAYLGVWGDGGDGMVVSDGTNWKTMLSSATIGQDESWHTYDGFFSFNIGSIFSDPNTVKSIDGFDLEIYVSAETLEPTDNVRIRRLDTSDKCGVGGSTYCNSKEEIAQDGSNFIGWWNAQYKDTTAFTSPGWKVVDIDSINFLGVGSAGYITLYLIPTNFEEGLPNDVVYLKCRESEYDPYITVLYTLWSIPTADADDITGYPEFYEPEQTYVVNTIVEDLDGRSDIAFAYLFLTDHEENYLVRFDIDLNTFECSTGFGDSYLTLNACGYANYGSYGYTLTWNFTVTYAWHENVIDIGTAVEDEEFWYVEQWWNQVSWYTNRFWLYTWDVLWIDTALYLEDGDYIFTNSTLYIEGNVFWHSTTYIYNGSNIQADLIIDGENLGDTYNGEVSLIDGHFNITTTETNYTTPETEDWEWSIDIELSNLPAGASEGPSFMDALDPLFLIEGISSGIFGSSGATVTVSIKPSVLVPEALTGRTSLESAHKIFEGTMSNLRNNDGQYLVVSSKGGTWQSLDFTFKTNYWNLPASISYEIRFVADGASENVLLRDFNPTESQIATSSGNPATISGSHALTSSNWLNGRLHMQIYGWNGDTGNAYCTTEIDYLYIYYDAFVEPQLTTRILNGTQVIDIITVESKAMDTTFTITDIPTSYSLLYLQGAEADYTDSISSTGTFTLSDTGIGTYKIYLDTGLTWHDVSFSPILPDGLGMDWQILDWFVNETQLNTMPFPLTHGFYTLLVKDGFSNAIISTNFTISPTDDKMLMFGIETLGIIPLYSLSIPSSDNIAYKIELERKDNKAYFPLNPLTSTEDIRIYGTVDGTNYTLSIYNSFDNTFVNSYLLSMPNTTFAFTPINEIIEPIPIASFMFREDSYYAYISLTTEQGLSNITIYDDSITIYENQPEGTPFRWLKNSIDGYHLITIKVAQSGWSDTWLNASYYSIIDILFATIVLNYYVNGTNEPLPANTLISSYIQVNTSYRISPYSNEFIWSVSLGDPTILGLDYFGRTLFNSSYPIPVNSTFHVIDIGLNLHRLTMTSNAYASINLTNTLNQSYSSVFSQNTDNGTYIKDFWLYEDDYTIAVDSNAYGTLSRSLTVSKSAMVNFRYRIPVPGQGSFENEDSSQTFVTILAIAAGGVASYFLSFVLRYFQVGERLTGVSPNTNSGNYKRLYRK